MASLADDLIENHAPAGLGRAAREALASSEAARRRILSRAQRRAERLHARTRRELMAADARLESLLAFSGRGE